MVRRPRRGYHSHRTECSQGRVGKQNGIRETDKDEEGARGAWAVEGLEGRGLGAGGDLGGCCVGGRRWGVLKWRMKEDELCTWK